MAKKKKRTKKPTTRRAKRKKPNDQQLERMYKLAAENEIYLPKSPRMLKRKQDQFLAIFAKTRSIGKAAKAVQIPRAVVEGWRREDAVFRLKWTEAWENCVDDLESSCFERATKGTRTLKVGYGGRAIIDIATGKQAIEVKHHDGLAMQLLKSNRKKYSESQEGLSAEDAVDMALKLLAQMRQATGGAR